MKKRVLTAMLVFSFALPAQKKSQELTVYVSQHSRAFYSHARSDLRKDGRKYGKNVVVKPLAELPYKLPKISRILIAAYAREWGKIAPVLARSEGADVILWLVARGRQAPPLPATAFDAVTSPSAEDPAKAAYRSKLQARLFQ